MADPRTDDRANGRLTLERWEIIKAVAIGLAALAGAAWVGVEIYIELFPKRGIEKAHLEIAETEATLAQLRRVPSLEFTFEQRELPSTEDRSAVLVNIRIKNPGMNMVVLDLGTEDDDESELEDFHELVLKPVGIDGDLIEKDYLRLDGNTKHWTRVLIDAKSTKVIPFLIEDIEPGLYHTEFRARLTKDAKDALIAASPESFKEELPIWWSANTYLLIKGDPSDGVGR